MRVCLNYHTGEGCGALNHADASECQVCGMPLRFALQLATPVVHERYRIERGIGCGRFGAIYQAEDLAAPGTWVALKESFNPDDILILRREFDVLQNLGHPNLPHYYEMFEADGSGYLVMEFVPGQSLADILAAQEAPLVESLVLSYAWQICDVLHFLHRQKPPVIHRDIKPANIRLTPEGLIKLVDFGFVKRGTTEDTSTVSGFSPGYAAPEQLMGGGGTGPQSDVYSLGATLYHLLTRQVPPSAMERIFALPENLLKQPRTLNRNVSVYVSYAVMKSMALSEKDRYPDIPALRQVLFGEISPLLPISARNADHVDEFDQHWDIGSYNIAWSPDSHLLAGAYHDGNCVIWDVWSGEVKRIYNNEKYVWGVVFAPDGEILASASEDETVKLWRVSTGELLHTLHGHEKEVWRVAFAPDGQLLASASWDTTVRLWRVNGKQPALLRTLESHTGGVADVAFSPNGHLLASAARDNTIKLWTLEGEEVKTLYSHEDTVLSVEFSPNSKLLASVSNDRTMKWWHMPDGELLHTSQEDDSIMDVAFAPNGEVIASASKDTSIKLWRTNDGTLLHTLEGHTGAVSSVAFSPDGQKIASAAQDRTVRLWGVR